MKLDEDMHVHSTISDGKHEIEENLEQAKALGLRRFGCVDHVRVDTLWVPEYVARVKKARAAHDMEVWIGVEAKILDQSGTLDMPADVTGVERVFVADHQFPLGHTCYRPIQIKEMLATGQLTPERCIEALVDSTLSSIRRYPNLVLAHLFSVLPKVGLEESSVPLVAIEEIARACLATGTLIEVDDRWRCPNERTVRVFEDLGVEVLCSSDSHKKENIGVYRHNADVAQALAA